MKAIFIDKYQIWFKSCSKCNIQYLVENIEHFWEHFGRENKRQDRFSDQCRKCRNEVAKIRKQKSSYEEKRRRYKAAGYNVIKNTARAGTKTKYGSAKDRKCELCNEQANQWHHFHYHRDSAVPLCEKCHKNLHWKP